MKALSPKSTTFALVGLVVVGLLAAITIVFAIAIDLVYPNSGFRANSGIQHSFTHSTNGSFDLTVFTHNYFLASADSNQVNAWYQRKGWEHITTWRDRYIREHRADFSKMHVEFSTDIRVMPETHPATIIDVGFYLEVFVEK